MSNIKKVFEVIIFIYRRKAFTGKRDLKDSMRMLPVSFQNTVDDYFFYRIIYEYLDVCLYNKQDTCFVFPKVNKSIEYVKVIKNKLREFKSNY